jgi:hypothetical protein
MKQNFYRYLVHTLHIAHNETDMSTLADYVSDSVLDEKGGIPSNIWCNAKQIYMAGLHQQKLSTAVLPNNRPLQNGMNN